MPREVREEKSRKGLDKLAAQRLIQRGHSVADLAHGFLSARS